MLIELSRLLSPGRYLDQDGVPADAVVTDEGDPEATDDGGLVRFEHAEE
ncbi:hypothetical protein ACNFIC_21245 [Pseudomonas sp. NY15463]